MNGVGRLLCSMLILSIVVTADTTFSYSEGTNGAPATVSSNSVSPQSMLEKSITSLKVADAKGKWNPASYQLKFANDATEFSYIHSIFPDRSGEHLIVVYQTDTKVFQDDEPKDGLIKIAAIQFNDGTKIWDTTIGNKELAKSVYNVQSNGEIFLTAKDKNNFYLYTIDEKTGKVNRTIKQSRPVGSGLASWRYWLIDHNQLLVTHAFNNQSTLRYFNPKGRLLQTRTITGTVWAAQSDRILVTDGNIVHYTLSVQDHKGNYTFKKSIDDPGYLWDAYLLPDLSVAIESQIKKNEKYGYGLMKYSAKGQKQWQHTTMDEPWPYFTYGNQILDLMGEQKKVVFLDNQGKATDVLTGNGDGWIDLKNREIYFAGRTTRIADAATMKWLAELQYAGSEPQISWLGKQKLAIYDSKNKIISVIRLTGK